MQNEKCQSLAERQSMPVAVKGTGESELADDVLELVSPDR